MAVYRVLKRLDTGHRPGDLVDGSQFSRLDVLVRKGALALAKSPPLVELPGWTARAEKLATIGVETVQDFLDADPQTLSELFNHKRGTTVSKWKDEARGWLRVERKSG